LKYKHNIPNTESERNRIVVVGVVVVTVTVSVDIPEVVVVTRVRRTQPPVVGRANPPGRLNYRF